MGRVVLSGDSGALAL